jgi:transcriptional regulator with XRE-family HTH domain
MFVKQIWRRVGKTPNLHVLIGAMGMCRMADVAENLRYLLWSHRIPREQWAQVLAAWGELAPARAKELLKAAQPTAAELRSIGRATDRRDEELQFGQLLESDRVDVLRENLRYLFSGLERGQKMKLAEALGVHQTTLSRWPSGRQSLRESKLKTLARFFGLDPEIDLRSEPIFLSSVPVGDRERRTLLHERIEGLDAETLRQLFPAFLRLLGEP